MVITLLGSGGIRAALCGGVALNMGRREGHCSCVPGIASTGFHVPLHLLCSWHYPVPFPVPRPLGGSDLQI